MRARSARSRPRSASPSRRARRPPRRRKWPSPKSSSWASSPNSDADLERVAGGEAEAPGRRRAAARDRDDDAPEARQVELVAAVPARHEHPVEARLEELPVRALRVVACARSVSAWRSISVSRIASARESISAGVMPGSGGAIVASSLAPRHAGCGGRRRHRPARLDRLAETRTVRSRRPPARPASCCG